MNSKNQIKYDFEQIVFLQGQEADKAMGILSSHGDDALLNYLQQWDNGGGHEVCETSTHGNSEALIEYENGYVLSYNIYLNYCGLQYKIERK